MFLNKFFKILLELVVVLVINNPQSFQWTDPGGCNYAKPVSRPSSEAFSINQKCNVSLTLNLQAVPATSQMIVQLFYEYPDIVSPDKSSIKIFLMYNDNEPGLLDCSDHSNLRKIDRWVRTDAFIHDGTPKRFYASSLDCSSKDGLIPGNYCLRVTVINGLEPCGFYYSKMETLNTFVVGESLQDSPTNFTPYGIIIGVLVILVVIGIVGFILIDRRRRGHFADIFSRTSQKLFPAMRSKPPVRLFLVYYPDCVHHFRVVQQLAAFLNANNCVVSYDELERDAMAVNRVGWLNQKLNGDYKILIINSWEALKRQQQWLENKKCYENDTFTSALSTILQSPSLASDYRKLFVLQPAYMLQEQHSRLQNIVPKRFYGLPDHLKVLLTHLHYDDPTEVEPVQMDAENLAAAWDHCRSAYANLANAIDGLIWPTDGTSTDRTGCLLCSAAASGDAVPLEDDTEALC